MATRDLGSIQVETAAAVPDAPRVDVLGGILGGAAEVIEGVGDIKVAQKREDLNEIADQALTEQQTLDQQAEVIDVADIGPRTGTFEGDKLLDRIQDLERSRAQASGSTLANVNLKLRQSVEDLRSNWPGLAKKLGSELNSFSALDPEMQALRMMEGQNTAFNKQAAADLDEIYAFAYKPVPDGAGLNPITHPRGSRVFAVAAATRSAQVDERSLKDSLRLTAEAGDKLDSRTNGVNFSAYMSGHSSVVKGYIEQTNVNFAKVAAAFNNPTDPANAFIINSSQGAFQQLSTDITGAIFDIEETLLNSFPPNQRDDVAFSSARAEADQYIGVLEGLQVGLASGDAKLVNAYAAFEAYKDLEFESQFPAQADVIRNLGRVSDLIEAMGDDLDGDGIRVRHDIASFMNNSMPSFLGRALGMTRNDFLPPNATKEQILGHYRRISAQNNDQYGNGQPTPEGNQVGAVTELANGKTESLMREARAGNIAPPESAALIGDKATNLDNLNRQGLTPDDAMQNALVDSLPDGVVELAIQSDKINPNITNVFIDEVERGLGQYDRARKRQYRAWYNEPLVIGEGSSVSALQALELDEEAIAKHGKVIFTVNADKLDTLIEASGIGAIPGEFELDRVPGGSRKSARIATRNQKTIRRLEELAVEMSREATEDLTINGRLMAVRTRDKNINWPKIWQNSGLSAVFGKLEPE